MSNHTRGPGHGDAPDSMDPLVARLSRADGPEASGPLLYDRVAARVERRAERRRAGLQAVGALAALTLAGGGVLGLVRGASRGATSNAASAASPGRGGAASPAAGTGARSATAEGQSPTGAAGTSTTLDGVAAKAAGDCPATLPSELATPTFADATHRLVATASGARVVICVYPLVPPSAAGATPAPAVSPGPAAGGRAVAADAAWLARIAALPASGDARYASGDTCPPVDLQAAAPTAARGQVYLLRLDYPTGGTSWLRVTAGGCGVYADNGAATSAKVADLLTQVHAAYVAGSPLRG